MKIIKVSYQKAFVTGPFLQEKIGFEAEIDDAEDSATAALSYLKSLAEGWHNNNNPHLYQDPNGAEIKQNSHEELMPYIPKPNFRQEQVPIIDKRWDRFEAEIENAQTEEVFKAVLDSYGLFPSKFLPIVNAKRQSFKS